MGGVRIDASQWGSVILGKTTPGAQIALIDLTTAVNSKVEIDGFTDVITADKDGRFAVPLALPQVAGDYMRLRTTDAQGKTAYTTLQVHGKNRADEVHLASFAGARLSIYADADGKTAHVEMTDRARFPVSEPFAQLRVINQRTHQVLNITCDQDGRMPSGLTLSGKLDDELSVEGRDAAGHWDLLGMPAVHGAHAHANDLPDPKAPAWALDDQGRLKLDVRHVDGPFIRDGISPDDVKQHMLNDCYFAAAVAAVAMQEPDLIQQRFQTDGKGAYSYWFSKDGRDVASSVDTDFIYSNDDQPLFFRWNTEFQPKVELWYAVLHKAYAQMLGGYEKMDHGGSAAAVLTALTGRPSRHKLTASMTDEAFWQELQTSREAVLVTYEPGVRKEKEQPVIPHHCYSVIDSYEDIEGKRWVTVRNPWGDTPGNGTFTLPLADARHWFGSIDSVPSSPQA